MTRIRTLLADDEEPARRRIRRRLDGRDDFELVAEAADGPAAVDAIRSHRPDLLFLDVQMPGLDGLEVLREAGEGAPPVVIFVTAFDDFALQAFEFHALDYLLKPFDDERLDAALEEAKAQVRRHRAIELGRRLKEMLTEAGIEAANRREEAAGRGEHPERFAVRYRGRIAFVDVSEIEWIEAAGDYVRLHAAEREYLLRATMRSMEERLDPARFIRIHRSTIVRIDRIRELSPQVHGDYEVFLRDATRLRLSRTYRDELSERLGLEL